MTSCRQACDGMMSVFRQQATEAESLRLEEHLAVCASCRSEKARWLLMEQLRGEAPQRLSEDARSRVLQKIITRGPAKGEVRELGTRRLSRPLLIATAGLAMIAIVFAARGSRNPTIAPPPSLGRVARAVPATRVEARTIRAHAPGTLEIPGAHIAYRAGTSFRILEHARRVELYAGEVDIDVAPGGPGRFRVIAPRFIVEVVGTHFVVRPSGVDTLRGTVRVVDANGRELAVLHAAQTWTLEDPNKLPLALADEEPSSVTPPANDLRPLASSPVAQSCYPSGVDRRPPRDSTRPAQGKSIDQLIARARSDLAAGRPERARARIASALNEHPTGRQRAIAGLLDAASFLVERRYDEALAAYRHTAESFGKYPESETAAFAIAQLLCERATADRARAALKAYIERYPEGRFVQDARRKLASLP